MTVLVTCASKHGATEEIARFVAERLRGRGIEADARPIAEVTDPAGYDAIVLGSGVYAGSWMKEASAFVRRRGASLSRMPAWLFSSGPIDPDNGRGVADRQLEELEEAIHPREQRVFGGTLDMSKLGFVERKIAKMVQAPEGDFRDWDAIAAFADEIADALTRDSTPTALRRRSNTVR